MKRLHRPHLYGWSSDRVRAAGSLARETGAQTHGPAAQRDGFPKRRAAIATIALLVAGCGGENGGGPDAGGETTPDAGAPEGCTPSGFCVETPFGPPVRYDDIWGAADDAVWVVGERGAVRFFDGESWSARDPEPAGSEDLVAVHGSGPDEVWAVGDGGAVWRWDGDAWSRVESGTTADLVDVSVAGPGAVFVAGTDATLRRWDGTGWSPMDSGAEGTVRAVHALRSDRVVATDGSDVFEWDGSRWTRTTPPPGATIRDLRAFEDSVLLLRAYLGGFNVDELQAGEAQQVISGGRSASDPDAYALFARAADDVAVAGPLGLIRHGVVDAPREVYHGSHSMRGVWVDSAGVIWAAGEYGTILRLDPGVDAPRVIDAGDMHTMLAVFVRSPTDVWMAGLGGKVVRFDGSSWTPVESGTEVDLYDLAGAPDGTVWAAGDHGVVVQFAPDGPVRRDLDRDVALRAVVPDGGAGIWVAGGAFERWDGGQWSEVARLGRFATDAWSPAPGEIWLAQANGWVSRYVDGVEQEVGQATTDDLFSIWGSGTEDVFIGAYANNIYRYDGDGWTEEDKPHSTTPGAVSGLWGTGPGDVYAVGNHLLRFDGSDWIDAAEIEGYGLRSVHGAGGEVWAVGWEQGIVRLPAGD